MIVNDVPLRGTAAAVIDVLEPDGGTVRGPNDAKITDLIRKTMDIDRLGPDSANLP